MRILPKIPKLFGQPAAQVQANEEREIIRWEAQIGGKLFGPIPEGHRREFFCLDEHTWVWHEEWTDENGKHHVITTRYDVRPTGVLKTQGDLQYQPLGYDEAYNLYKAVGLYEKSVEQALRAEMSAA